MNSDGSITINADTTFYFGSYNNIINKDVFQDSLSNGDYDVTFKNTPKGVEFRLKRKNLSKHSIFKLGQKIPELKLVDINQNEISVADNKKYSSLVQITFMFDLNNNIGYKDSPIDCGKEIFLKMFNERVAL